MARRAFAIRCVIALFVVAVLTVGTVVAVNGAIDQKLTAARRVKITAAHAPRGGANYLLVGSDTRAGARTPAEKAALCDASQGCDTGQRSDTLMVLHVEPNAGRMLLVSFPRDLLVTIPGIGAAKINAAYNTDLGGGADTVIQTLKANFGIAINHYLAVDFNSFRGIVKTIGGLRLSFPYATRDDYSGLNIPSPGCVSMDGDTALAYVRARYYQIQDPTTGQWQSPDPVPDIGRIRRQQAFVRMLLGIAVRKSLANPLTANKVADRVVANLTVDQGLTKDDIFGLIRLFAHSDPNDSSTLDTETFPWHDGPLFGGQSVLYPQTDAPDGQALLARINNFNPDVTRASPTRRSVKVRVVNASGRDHVATETQHQLVKLGFKAHGAPATNKHVLARTEVRYPPGAVTGASLVAQDVQPAATLVQDRTLPANTIAIVVGRDFSRIQVPVAPTAGQPPGSSGQPQASPAATNADATPC